MQKRTSSRRAIRIVFLLAWLAVFPAAGAFAETVILKNGDIVRGLIILEDRTSLVIETEAGARSFQKRDVEKIFYSDAQAERWQTERLERNSSSGATGRSDRKNPSTGFDWIAAGTNLLLPGYSHFQRGDRNRGILYLGGTVLSFAWLYERNRAFRTSRSGYRAIADSLYVWPRNFAESLVYAYQLNEEHRSYSLVNRRGAARREASYVFGAIYFFFRPSMRSSVWIS